MRAAGVAWCLFALSGCHDHATPAIAGSSGSSEGSSGGGTTTGSSSDGSGGADESSTTGGPPVVPGEGPFAGGTRLRPVVERSDTATRLLHWYDALLGIECEFARDASGELRCLPLAVPSITVGFATQDCEDGVVQAQSCAALPSWVRTTAPGAADCDTGARQLSYRRGAPMAAPASLYEWAPAPGLCVWAGDVVGDHYDIDRADDEMFLAAQFVDEPGDDGLAIRAVVADDGSFERVRLLDAATGRPCSAQLALVDNAAIEQCRVDGIAYLGRAFASSDCASEPLAVVSDDGSCDPPALATDGAHVYELGPPFDGYAFADGGSGCELFEPSAHETVYAIGPAVTMPAFAPIVRAPVPADDRLQPQGVEIAGTPVQLTRPTGEGAWYDTALDYPCDALALPSGGHVCAPAIAYPQDDALWGDPECTSTPLVRLFDELPPLVVFVKDDGCRPLADRAQAVVEEWTDVVYRSDPRDMSCTAIDREGIRYMRLGNTVELGDLPALTVETLAP